MTDAIAGLGLKEGALFKSGQQMAQVGLLFGPQTSFFSGTKTLTTMMIKMINPMRIIPKKVKEGRAVVSGTNTLIGSIATLLSSVKRSEIMVVMVMMIGGDKTCCS